MIYAALLFAVGLGFSVGFAAGCLSTAHANNNQEYRARKAAEDWFNQHKNGE